ncbi:unnamed protein product [Rotaria sordida]|uniref:RING-type domain-containing protein n=1 Tax=Rotaria sordida TaxID=392033 RepID=A0A813YY99_9BILA|nr:unnamed protein product [Rotaria sordida]
MSRQYSTHSFISPNHHHHISSNNSTRRRFRQSIQNNFSYFQYPFQRQTFESNREINNTNYHSTLPFNRISTTATISHHNNHTKRQRRSSTIGISNFQTNQYYHERKRSRHYGNEREHINHPSRRIQQTNPTTYNIPSFSRSFHYRSHNHSIQTPRYFHHESISSSNTNRHHQHHRNRMTFEPTLYHRTLMTTHVHQQPSSSFLLTNLLHRIIDNHHPLSASFDLIGYAWMSPNHEIFSLPTAFTIHFGDFFDLIISDETSVVGLTDSELERIPTMIYKKTCTNIKDDDDDKCTICLSEYITNEKLKRLRCKHYFHSECIDPWLKTSTRCPICRNEQTS